MNLLTKLRPALVVLLFASFATAADKPTPTYQKGTITGYESRLDTWGMSSNANRRREKVYELTGTDLVYQVGYCGAFQAGKFTPGQSVEYRVDNDRMYILHDGDKEYKCKIEGTKTVAGAKADAPSTTPPPDKP